MKPTAIFYGSTSGNCESIAAKIASALGIDSSNVFSVSELNASRLTQYDNLIIGSSTWGSGDLQDEWYGKVDVIKSSDLSGKTVAIFGCGDSCGFSSTFCDAMAELFDAAKMAGAKIVGEVSTDGYTFDESRAIVDGQFVGLALDEDNESDKTDERIDAWVAEIKHQL